MFFNIKFLDFIITIMLFHRHLKDMITFSKKICLGPMPFPVNVIPWFQMNGKVGQPSNNSAIQAPYRFFRIICLQECKCHCINIMDTCISIWTSNNIISFHVFFSEFFYNRLSKPEMYFSCNMIKTALSAKKCLLI